MILLLFLEPIGKEKYLKIDDYVINHFSKKEAIINKLNKKNLK